MVSDDEYKEYMEKCQIIIMSEQEALRYTNSGSIHKVNQYYALLNNFNV